MIRSSVGRPIHVPKEDRPSKELVEKIQALYIEELMRYAALRQFRSIKLNIACRRIWNTYKDVYAKERTRWAPVSSLSASDPDWYCRELALVD